MIRGGNILLISPKACFMHTFFESQVDWIFFFRGFTICINNYHDTWKSNKNSDTLPQCIERISLKHKKLMSFFKVKFDPTINKREFDVDHLAPGGPECCGFKNIRFVYGDDVFHYFERQLFDVIRAFPSCEIGMTGMHLDKPTLISSFMQSGTGKYINDSQTVTVYDLGGNRIKVQAAGNSEAYEHQHHIYGPKENDYSFLLEPTEIAGQGVYNSMIKEIDYSQPAPDFTKCVQHEGRLVTLKNNIELYRDAKNKKNYQYVQYVQRDVVHCIQQREGQADSYVFVIYRATNYPNDNVAEPCDTLQAVRIHVLNKPRDLHSIRVWSSILVAMCFVHARYEDICKYRNNELTTIVAATSIVAIMAYSSDLDRSVVETLMPQKIIQSMAQYRTDSREISEVVTKTQKEV